MKIEVKSKQTDFHKVRGTRQRHILLHVLNTTQDQKDGRYLILANSLYISTQVVRL